jgi:hypothetical protein
MISLSNIGIIDTAVAKIGTGKLFYDNNQNPVQPTKPAPWPLLADEHSSS